MRGAFLPLLDNIITLLNIEVDEGGGGGGILYF